MLKTEWLSLALALLLGAAFPLGFAPLGWWPVSLLSAAGLFLVLNNARRQWLLLAWSYGVGKYLAGRILDLRQYSSIRKRLDTTCGGRWWAYL
jgi:apolipoprotein N-acyltransferase